MDLKQYVQDAIRTESRIETVKVDPTLLTSILQIMIAAGNMLDQVKKNAFYDRAFDNDKLTQEFAEIIGALDGLKYVLVNGQERVEVGYDPRMFHSIVGIATESVELLEALAKPEIDMVNVLEEFGDLNWYQAIGIDAASGDFGKILETNIEKLRARYPEKFTSENAINRDLATEREILENGN